MTKDELMKAVWPDSFVEESNLTQTIFMVRKALDESSDQRYILNVQGRGYRFLLPITKTTDQAGGIEPPVSPSQPESVPDLQLDTRPRRIKDSKLAVIATAVVAILISGSAIWRWRSRHIPPEQPDKITLAVLPFENFTGDPNQEYFSDGLTEEMISQLGNLDPAHLGVIARTSVMRYKHSQASIPQIGEDLGVKYVIEGSVRRDSERVRITAQLIQVKDQTHLWAREYDRDLGHLLELQEEIAREVANEIEFSLSGRRPIEATREGTTPLPGAQSYEAYDLYLKGRYFWSKRTGPGFQQAADYFQQAIDKDPNYGPAYAGAGGHLRLDEHLVCRSAKRVDAESANCGPAGAETRREPRRGACLPRVDQRKLRLRLAGSREGIPQGDSIESAICHRAPMVCRISFVARTIPGGACRERAGKASGSVVADYWL